jgi:hypothetical protein
MCPGATFPPPPGPALLGSHCARLHARYSVTDILAAAEGKDNMQITDVRFSFSQVETLAEPLAARPAPAIPRQFLLNQAEFEQELRKALDFDPNALELPWHDKFGKLFWFHYLEGRFGRALAFNHCWRQLVPLLDPNVGSLEAPWLGEDGDAEIRAHYFPWGIGVIVDVRAVGSWSPGKLVDDVAFKVRKDANFDWTFSGKTQSLPMNTLISKVIDLLRQRAYGLEAAPGTPGSVFSIVTVLDGKKATSDDAIADQSKMHRVLDALVSWSPQWKKTKLDAIANRAIEIKSSLAPPGHMLYGGKRGRAVWFPGSFPASAHVSAAGLRCYHRNLSAAALQTESLCSFAREAVTRANRGTPIGAESATYANCAKLTAGILGRLYGAAGTTYRSRTVRDQIDRNYLADVNALRGAVNMTPL